MEKSKYTSTSFFLDGIGAALPLLMGVSLLFILVSFSFSCAQKNEQRDRDTAFLAADAATKAAFEQRVAKIGDKEACKEAVAAQNSYNEANARDKHARRIKDGNGALISMWRKLVPDVSRMPIAGRPLPVAYEEGCKRAFGYRVDKVFVYPR